MAVSEFSDVFVSYRRKNVDFTKQIVKALREEDKEVWVDWEDIPPGSVGFTDDIQKGIEGADTFVCVLSPDYMESEYCLMELDHAIAMNKKLIPIVYHKFDGYPVPSGIGHINWIYFTPHAGQENTFADSFPKVMDAIDTDLDHVRKHKRLLIRALEWKNNNRKNGFLLMGDELDEASSWVVENANLEPHPTDLQLAYIDESRKYAERRQRLILTGVTITLVVSVVLTIISIISFTQAETERFRSNVRLLANRLPAISSNDPFVARSIAQSMLELGDIPMIAQAAAQTNLLTSAAFDQYEAHTDIVNDVEFINNGSQFLTGSDDGLVLLWDALQQEPVLTYEDERNEAGVKSLSVSSDYSHMLTGSHNGTVLYWDIESGNVINAFTEHNHSVNAVRFLTDDQHAVSADVGGAMYLWNITSGEIIREFDTQPAGIFDLEITPDNSLMVTGMGRNAGEAAVILWDVMTGEILAEASEHTDDVYGVDITNDGTRIISGSADNNIILWDVIYDTDDEDEDVVTLEMDTAPFTDHVDEVWDVAFNFAEDRFISVSGDRTVHIWEFNRRSTPRILTGHSGWINALAITPDDQLIVTTADDKTAILWNLERSSLITQYRPTDRRVLSIAISPDEATVAAGIDNGSVVFIDAMTETMSEPIFENESRTESTAFMPDGTLLTGHCLLPQEFPCTTAEVIRWDVTTQTVIDRYEYEIGLVTDMDVGSNEALGTFFVVSGTGIINEGEENSVFDVVLADENGIEIGRFSGHGDAVDGIAISPDGEQLLTASRDGLVKIWDINDQSLISDLEGHDDWVSDVAWFPNDPRYVMSTSWDGTLIQWDTQDSIEPIVRQLEGHQGAVMEVAISADGRTALSGSRDSVVFLWDIAIGEPIRVLNGHTDDVISLYWVGDGLQAYSGSYDGTVRYWRVFLEEDSYLRDPVQEVGRLEPICIRDAEGETLAESYSVPQLCGNFIERTLDRWSPNN